MNIKKKKTKHQTQIKRNNLKTKTHYLQANGKLQLYKANGKLQLYNLYQYKAYYLSFKQILGTLLYVVQKWRYTMSN